MNGREKLIEILRVPIYPHLDADPAEVVADYLLDNGVTVRERGRWEIYDDGYGCELMYCPICKSEFYDGDNDTIDQLHNFCPNCGADMRGEEDGN